MNKKLVIFLPMMALIGMSASSCLSMKAGVVIYSSLEDYRIKYFQEKLNEKFLGENIILQSLSTGTMLSRLQAEGNRTMADIILALEVSNAEMVIAKDPYLFADLSDYDTSKYLDVMRAHEERHHLYHICVKDAGSIIVNNKVLKEKGLKAPKSYEELLNPMYKDLIMMPNPKSSGTGYYFYKNLAEVWGEEKALNYFNDLSENVKEFSNSGSGPVKSLARGEIAIGLGITFQAAKYKVDNPDLEITYFEEGSPYNLYTMSIINGREKTPLVKSVYDFIYNDLIFQDKAKFAPDQIYKDEYQPETELEYFPKNVKYAEMGDIYDPEYKKDLLDKWKW